MTTPGRIFVRFGVRRTLFGIVVGWAAAALFGLVGRHSQGSLTVRPDRRQFIRNAALSAAGTALALVGVGFGLLLWPNKTGAFGGELTVRSGDVPQINAPPFRSTAGHFYLAHNPDGLLAMWWKCPHLGCTVPWVGPVDSPQAYRCPCHGSMYDSNGLRTGGPAPRPLDLMQVTVAGDGSVRVATGEITTRSGYTPSQAVPYPA